MVSQCNEKINATVTKPQVSVMCYVQDYQILTVSFAFEVVISRTFLMILLSVMDYMYYSLRVIILFIY